MMRSMGFKSLVLASAVAVASLNANAAVDSVAPGIPVMCMNCVLGTYNAAHSIMDAIRAQTEALLNGMDYVMRTEQELATSREVAREVTRQRIKNSYEMEPSLGAKPRSACAQFSAAAMSSAAAQNTKKMKEKFSQNSQQHNKRNENLAPQEPRQDYAVKEIFEKLDDPKKPVDSGKILLDDEPINPDDAAGLAWLKAIINLLTNPFPAELPSDEDVERIKKNGSPAEKQFLARSIAMNKRLEVSQSVFDEKMARNVQSLDSKKLGKFIEEVSKSLSPEQKKLLTSGKISQQQLDELLNTFRVNSPTWVADVMSKPTDSGAKRDQLLMSAQMLNMLWQINQTQRQILQLMAAKDSREVSQAGLQSR